MEKEFAVNTVGVGIDFNEQLMTEIADKGAGNYYYLEERRYHIDILKQEISNFNHTLEQQYLQYEQLKLKADAYFHRKEQNGLEPMFTATEPSGIFQELSEEEVELELLRRKEMLKGGAVS